MNAKCFVEIVFCIQGQINGESRSTQWTIKDTDLRVGHVITLDK